jgi:hypothetical protein
MTDSPATPAGHTDLVKTTHPLRGVLWGVLFGLGLMLVLIATNVIRLDLIQMLITLILGIALGMAWSIFGPARKPKG